MGNELKVYSGISDIERMAAIFAKSGLFGINRPEQAAALMFVAQAEGRHPASVAMDYHIIQGRPALKADAMLSRFQAAGGSVKWQSMTDQKVEGTFTHPQGGTVTIDWTIDRAQTAGLIGKAGGNWQKYPRQMLRARVISEGVRAVFPGVLGGMYAPEEVESFTPGAKDAQPVDAVITSEPEPEAKPEPAPIDYSICPKGKNKGKAWILLDIDTLRDAEKYYAGKDANFEAAIQAAIMVVSSRVKPEPEAKPEIVADTDIDDGSDPFFEDEI